MKQKKLVIFDWGGVIESHKDGEYNYKIIYKKILKRMGLKEIPDDFLEKIFSCNRDENRKHIFAENSKEGINKYIERFYKVFGLSCTKKEIDEFKIIYLEEFEKSHYYKDISKYIASLEDVCYVGVLSNLITLDGVRIRNQINFSKLDFRWLSYEMNSNKPDEGIFIKVLKECKFNPSDILFLDDSIENLKTAHNLGFKTYLVNGYDFDNIKKTIEDFLRN